MNILLTNDDGVYSIGIQTLAKRLTEAGHKILLLLGQGEKRLWHQ
jgi:broad specificity polyphosphatase/5'/3'-nucleotidase SurE